MHTTLGKLEEITDLRTIWPHEALDFTKWLAEEDNIALLSDAIGMEINVEESESPVGAFNVDIFATETGTDRKIIIENQLEDTNHDHLGKLITYASGKGADVIVWVVKKARDEHRAAIEWLNNRTDKELGFFLCEIKLYKIGDSAPAVKFDVIESPNEWSKTAKAPSEADSIRGQKRLEYWTAFNYYAFSSKNEFSNAFNMRKPSFDHWMAFSIGSSGCALNILQVRKYGRVEVDLYINDDKPLFDSLFEHRQEIEESIGAPLDWRRLDDKKASRIIVKKDADFEDKDTWPKHFNWIMETMLKMKFAFGKYLQ